MNKMVSVTWWYGFTPIQPIVQTVQKYKWYISVSIRGYAGNESEIIILLVDHF